MGRLERYILRQATSAFALCLAALTSVVWMTQALRELDLLTLKGQALSVFFMMTGLLLPTLVLAIAPIALFVAVVYTLNRLNADSELVVTAAAGIAPWRVARPFIVLAVGVAALCGLLSIVVAPSSLGALRLMITQVRADIIATMVRDGRFTEVERGLTFHVRERAPDGALLGLLVSDARDPKRVMTYLAERGEVVETAAGGYLVMQTGAIQRRDDGRPDATIIAFQSYAIDLSQFAAPGDDVFFKPRERSTWALLNPDTTDPQHARFTGKVRGELHDRLSAAVYPIAFALLALAFVGEARSNRQSRFAALVTVGLCVLALRATGFGLSSMVVANEAAVPLVYLVPVLVVLGGFVAGRNDRVHSFVSSARCLVEALGLLGAGRSARTAGAA